MTLNDFTDGQVLTGTQLDSNYGSLWRSLGCNHIRTLMDRAVTYSAGQVEGWGEAYISSTGRNSAVVSTLGAGYAVFDTNKYKAGFITDMAPGDTLHDPDSWTNPTYAFDGDDTTMATLVVQNATKSLGKTFSSKYVYIVRSKFTYFAGTTGDSGDMTVKLQTYNGSTWADFATLVNVTSTVNNSGTPIEVSTVLNSTVQGVRLSFIANGSVATEAQRVYSIQYGVSGSSTITHTLPLETFSPTISSSMGVPLIADWENGADLKYKLTSLSDYSGPFVVIEATKILGSFAINNCKIVKLTTGKWILYCTTGTDEVKRAQIYKTLFYGTTGADPRVSTTYISGITALKTSVARDVGKRCTYFTYTNALNVGSTYTGTFVNTTTNTSCSLWSYCSAANFVNSQFEKPSGTIINSASGSGTISDETGTDTSADESNNPATVQAEFIDGGSFAAGGANIKAIILNVGGLTFAESGGGTGTNYDFYATGGIPLLTATTETPVACDSGWLSCSDSPSIQTFTAFTSEPNSLVVQLVPKASSPIVGYPSIYGFYVRAE